MLKSSKPWPSLLDVEQFAFVADVSARQARSWSASGVLQMSGLHGRKKVFPWSEALVALLALKLQRTCGEKSPLPLTAARDARPRLREHLEWSVEPSEPLRVTVSAPDLAAIEVTVSLDELRALAARLEELGARDDERRRGAVSAGSLA